MKKIIEKIFNNVKISPINLIKIYPNIKTMWLILSRIWGAIKNIFRCCCPHKLNCYSTCCDAELHIENEKKENNEYKETDKRFKVGSLEYSYHDKKTKEINDENENKNNNNI